ncbi:MAG: DUF4192 domain-containing protein [Streptosporangiaceae bacterium]
MTDTHPSNANNGGPGDARRPTSDPGSGASADGGPGRPRCRVRIGSADAVLAVIPHLLGFNPASSLVLLGIGGPHARVRLAFRYDLPDPPDEALAADIAAHASSVLNRQHLATAIVVGYGSGRLVTPIVDSVGPALRAAGVAIRDALRVEDGRYWSYLCTDPACCPPEGVAFDPSGHPAAEALGAAGLTVHADREALAATIAPDPGPAAEMSAAVSRAVRRAGRLIDEALATPDCDDPLQAFADAGRRAVRIAVSGCRRGARITDPDEIAWLGLALTDLRVRDDAWARMDPRFRRAHEELWAGLVRRLPAEYVPAPAALLAFTAWQAGDGALASVAIERALAADPGYSMALLIAEALHAGLPPSAARLTMTPKQVAASYARRRAATRHSGTRPPAGPPARRRSGTRSPAGPADARPPAGPADARPPAGPVDARSTATGRPLPGPGQDSPE